jgi:CheY-like chemotaxis protein
MIADSQSRRTGLICTGEDEMPAGPFERPCERVLVVNDDADFVEAVREILETSGVVVETASSPVDAARVLDGGFVPSVVLVDARLNGGTAEPLVLAVRGDPSLRAVRIVVMAVDARNRFPVGLVDETLVKPFGADKLFQVLARPGCNG